MENLLRAAAIAWLRDDPELATINAIEEESPLSASPPWLGIAASATTDWSTKDRVGREVRIAFELETRGDEPAADAALIQRIGRRLQTLPREGSGYSLVSAWFLRARSERRSNNLRGALLEYRFRLLEPKTE
ncbi:MAG: DUF3168 domain-containing protein [Pseudomonadota bacterium]